MLQCFALICWCAMITSCKKTILFDREYMIFGESFNECDGDCAHFLILEDTKVYKDYFNSTSKTHYTDYFPMGMRFENRSLSANKFEIAKSVSDSFPDYLIAHPNETFGSIDTRDQGEIYIEFKKKGKKVMKWRIDYDETQIPTEIRPFIKQIKAVIQSVYF